jgi:hypothetical protein
MKLGKLTEREAWYRLQSALRVLQAHLQMKNHNDLLHESSDLSQRHRGTIEELIIWSLIYQSFNQQSKDAIRKDEKDRYIVQMLETRDKMKGIFDSLPMSAFTGAGTEYTRGYWEKTWFAPEK